MPGFVPLNEEERRPRLKCSIFRTLFMGHSQNTVTKLTPKNSLFRLFWGQFCDSVLTVAHQKPSPRTFREISRSTVNGQR
jgi:hypothetical protein